MGHTFARSPLGYKFGFGGMKLNVQPDSVPDGKFPIAINIRGTRNDSVRTRPGQTLLFSAAASITEIATYTALGTDNRPRILSSDSAGKVYLDTGIQVGMLATSGAVLGASLLPFRPSESPTPWMYIANGADYQKFSAPGVANAVTQQKVGIAEPQSAPDAGLFPTFGTAATLPVTQRPTLFQNPWAHIPGALPFANPGNVFDGNPATFAEGTATLIPATASACLWYGWAAATVSYGTLTIYIDCDSNAAVGGNFTIFLSFDGGMTSGGSYDLSYVTTRQTVAISISPGTDLSQLQVSTIIGTSGNPNDVKIYEIYTVGVPASGFSDETGVAADWVTGGTATGVADIIGPDDTALAVFPDPVNPSIWSTGISFATTPPAPWQVGATVQQGAEDYLLLDVILPGIAAEIASIYYFAGTSGRCIIVPSNLPARSVPSFSGADPKASPFLSPSALAALRRGAILQLGGSEYVYVLSVSTGPENTVCIETSTVGTFAAGSALAAIPTLILFGATPPTTTTADIDEDWLDGTATTGIGTFTRTIAFFAAINSATGLQPEDYLHLSLGVDDPSALTQIDYAFDVGDGSFTEDYFYYSARANDLTQSIDGTATQLAVTQTAAQRAAIDALSVAEAANLGNTTSGAQLALGPAQRTEIRFPISALTRVGQSANSLVDTVAVRITVTCTADIHVYFGSLSTWGGGQPDVGDAGAPYFYRVRPRSQVTGVVGNPSPSTRYGVNPLRFPVLLDLPSAAYDPQIDTWDIFRYGGSVTSWRFIGSTPSANTQFTDNFGDAAAQAGNPLDFDNFEPWPSIDLPLNATALTVVGTTAVVAIPSPTLALRYLPGNLVQIAGANVYTLQTRPILLSPGMYLMQFVENAGSFSSVPISIYEPALANQPLPYSWGPDAAGTVFAVGDPLRAGTLYFSKGYAPDSAPDTYNIEITPPSEPLLGGLSIDGLAYVASSDRWWALYPQPQDARQRYSIVQQPLSRGLAAPFGACTDGKSLFWWAEDGIYDSASGSLTDEDLYTLFPHEGVAGSTVTYGAGTIPAPDYSRAGTFRIAYANSYLYATYQDSSAAYHTLVCDLRRKAWSLDNYSPQVSMIYHVPQPAGTLLTSTALYPSLLMATVGPTAKVASQTELANDLSAAVSSLIAQPERDSEDTRAPKQWGDMFFDAVPAALAGVVLTPMSLGAGVAAPSTIPSGTTRVRIPLSIGGIVVSDFLGATFAWTDDFATQTAATRLFEWQPSWVVQPTREIAWITFGSSFGVQGYLHIRELAMAWVSTAPITVTIMSYDGQSPATLILPSSSGAFVKQLIPLTPNKGQLYRFAASSPAAFQLFLDDSEIRVGAWQRGQAPYAISRDFGGRTTDASPV